MILAVGCAVHQLAILLPTVAGVLAATIVALLSHAHHSTRRRAIQRGALAGAITCALVFGPALWLLLNSEAACQVKAVYVH